jgi:sulfoxide reductase heme-binding subunit YedZ
VVIVLALVPAAWTTFALISDFFWNTRYLGADPIETLELSTGEWALRFLALTLLITPLRRITGANWLQKYRRSFGLITFTYAAMHLSTYVGLDIQFYWDTLRDDFTKRPYIIVGMLAFLTLLALAVTSTKGWIKRLGKNWVRLHYGIYVAAILANIHFWMSVKADLREPIMYTAIFVVLLGYRVWHSLRSRSAPRGSSPSSTASSVGSV